jgi:uncharacterized membrane protein
MVYSENMETALFLSIILFFVALTFGQWVQITVLLDKISGTIVPKKKSDTRQWILRLIRSNIRVGILVIVSLGVILYFFPKSYDNLAIGILTGWTTGLMITEYQKEFGIDDRSHQ